MYRFIFVISFVIHPMITFEQALHIVLDAVGTKDFPYDKCELLALEQANGRIIQQAIFADRDMPAFDKSAVDGYACTSIDLETRSPMRLLEVIPAGVEPKYAIAQGDCSKVMTGAMVPKGTECVLMVEDALERDGSIYACDKPKIKSNICFQGEDTLAKTQLFSPGTLLKPQHIAILSAYGYTSIRVATKIKVGVISTGDELIEPWEAPQKAQIRNSNGLQLLAQCKESGVLPTYYGIAKDQTDSLAPIMAKAIRENEVVLVSGGVSMGDFDIVPETVKNLGITILFDRIAVQPGKPTTFGMGEGRFFFGLPGNPVSSFIQFELMVKPFLMKLMGTHYAPTSLFLPLAHSFGRKQAERLAHLPATIDATGFCNLIDYHGSGHISALDKAQCLVRIPVGVHTLSIGAFVEVILI
ncbi:MAG: molybdopterin molybdotransferase MoeA [Prevotellaceae bacterium]|nr:molybdopterin molybdotransferase MoeA [Prevotellaceae bacterium]